MRKRDMHILSAGILMYTSDLRFQVIHPDKSENWTLQIKSPQERDSGVYECQVSTEPKMSLNYSLNVVGECYLNYSRIWPGYVNRDLVSIYFEVSLSIGGADVTAVDRLLSHGKDCSRHESGDRRG
ncbi:lachesin-like protein [Lasius niger]|uniref:Lachesin-like protein n=1 Tax=Lasius niger TaxID=67767 RepID=A0A0J7KV98_LASNI|nr:lachesin-like protein [Lasius niger]